MRLGLGIDLLCPANSLYAASRHATEVIAGAIKDATPFEPSVHDDLVLLLSVTIRNNLISGKTLFSEVCQELDPLHQRVTCCGQ